MSGPDTENYGGPFPVEPKPKYLQQIEEANLQARTLKEAADYLLRISPLFNNRKDVQSQLRETARYMEQQSEILRLIVHHAEEAK